LALFQLLRCVLGLVMEFRPEERNVEFKSHDRVNSYAYYKQNKLENNLENLSTM